MRQTPRLIRSAKQLSIVLLMVALSGCLSIADPPKGLTILAITGGNNQNIAVNATSDPLVVRAYDETGTPMPGIVVSFTITVGAGTLSATSATTDASGDAKVTYKPATTLGNVNIRGTSADLQVTFTEVVIAAT